MTKFQWIPSLETLVSFPVLVQVGGRHVTPLGPATEHGNLTFLHTQKYTRACSTFICVSSAGPNIVTVQLGLTTEGLTTDDLATDQTHAGGPALLPHGPRAREVGDVVDKLGVVCGQTDQAGNCGGEVHLTWPHLNIGMVGPVSGQLQREGGVQQVLG